MSDVIQQLDLAAGENQRLKDRLKENNMILEQKVQEIEQCLVSRDKDKHQLEGRLRELQGRLREAEERALEADRQRRALEEQRKKEPDSLKCKRTHTTLMSYSRSFLVLAYYFFPLPLPLPPSPSPFLFLFSLPPPLPPLPSSSPSPLPLPPLPSFLYFHPSPFPSADEDTNKFFEARVAVMGFKCRVMQLQGELEAQRKELRDNSSGVLARDEVERLERENVKLKSELAEARDLARKHASGGGNLRREKVMRRRGKEEEEKGEGGGEGEGGGGGVSVIVLCVVTVLCRSFRGRFRCFMERWRAMKLWSNMLTSSWRIRETSLPRRARGWRTRTSSSRP